jgi:hypothetical protein
LLTNERFASLAASVFGESPSRMCCKLDDDFLLLNVFTLMHINESGVFYGLPVTVFGLAMWRKFSTNVQKNYCC